MEQKNSKEQKSELPFSMQLKQDIINKPLGAKEWQQAAISFTQNRQEQRIRTLITVVIGVIIGVLVIHFIPGRTCESDHICIGFPQYEILNY